MGNWGEMVEFKLDAFLTAASELVRADEAERALWLLDNLPAYYRDHQPEEALELKREILKRIATPRSYIASDKDMHLEPEYHVNMDRSLRGQLLVQEVIWLNEAGFVPHIVDCGPGEYWLPMLLNRKECKFTYQPVYLNEMAYQKAKSVIPNFAPNPGNQPVIFVACEIIEHLWREEDLRTEMLYHADLADIVHVSTPKYTFGHNYTEWRETKKTIEHLRSYTPNEFANKVVYMFPEYKCQYMDSEIMHMRCLLQKSKYPAAVQHQHIVLEFKAD